MDVDVDFLGGNGQVQHEHREAAGGHDAAVGLADGGGEEAVADPAAVDEEGDVGARGPLEVGLGDEAVDAESLAGRELDKLVDEGRAVDGEEGGAEVAVAGGADTLAVAVVQGEGDVGVTEGGAGDGGDDVTELGAFGLEELKAGGDGAEKAADGDAGAAGAADGPLLDDALVAGEDFAAGLALGGDGSQREFGHGGDAGEGLAAEAEGLDAGEVIDGAELAGAVAFDGEATWSGGIPVPSSVISIRALPPCSTATSMRRAPASRALSRSSRTTEAGRSMTSPAAILPLISGGRRRMLTSAGFAVARRAR